MSEQPNRDKKGKAKSRNKRFVWEFLGCAAVVVGVVAFAPIVISWWQSYVGTAGTLGEFGDQFGAANALFAGLAFAGVIVAMRMQSKELELQREELEDTREVMKQQTFENTFFKMVSLAVETIEAATYGSHGQAQPKGREAILQRMEAYRANMEGSSAKMKKELEQSGTGKRPLKPLDIINAYRIVSEDMSFQYGQLFRQIDSTLRFVHRSDMADKEFYMDILKAQLSQSELRIFLYMSLLLDECRDTIELFNLYGFFKLLDVNHLVSPEDLKLLDYVQQEHEQRLSEA